MAILVTGGAGYIGSHAVVELLKENYEVIVVDNLSNSKIDSINRVKEIAGKDFPFYICNLSNKEALTDIFRAHSIEAVMHFAGLKAVGESVSIPLKYYYTNIIGTLNLCEVMKEFNVKKLIFSSSATVYGNPEIVPIKEDFPLSATNPYGQTKLMIENILKDLHVSDPSWRIVLLRYFNPIGAHESGRIGENPNGIPNNIMPYITQVAIGNLEKLSVFGNDYDTVDGTGVRDFIHVTDLVKGHIKALEYTQHHEGIETFNLGTGQGYSVLDLVNTFKDVTGQEIPYVITERRPGDIGVCYADPTKAENKLGWRAEKNLLEMCQDSWTWQSKNPKGY
ncbi:UDP-glucose 4-epimerase GalE [Jeotgalibacillus proteolyticus]|uniref:UDP-glucose 4-epimerase n=1 Tax=Jeotgalibacillus proteolyticus TaxID=2082395 RepID=A0A2S5GBC3_9BACL|nr:UDP-glucose 4-epimerase GalE [Jeotgalibacillus proteolyticus]PPA70289.1 UDP-glucose 4-epimerase GalE [Jeotgalibacillus proteolyticus]